jgi:hypothetical protein
MMPGSEGKPGQSIRPQRSGYDFARISVNAPLSSECVAELSIQPHIRRPSKYGSDL